MAADPVIDPPHDMIQAWAGPVGRTWAKLNAVLDRQLEPIGRVAMERAGIAPGEALLDVGCGAGATTMQLAQAVGQDGWVIGVDVSPPLLALAGERAAEAHNVSFVQADAQRHPFAPAAFHRLYSRFGVMFFDDPVAAFANLRAAARPGATLAFCCWRRPDENRWMNLPLEATREMFPDRPAADLDAPGPFALASDYRIKTMLQEAGWTGHSIDPLDIDIGGSDVETSVQMLLRVGSLGAALREAGATAELMGRADALVRRAIEPYASSRGVMIPSASWIVTARNPR